MVKLIVHIGHGKTGSSSIQETLLSGRDILADQGIAYLGLMLEHGGGLNRHDWQKRSGSDIFFANARDPLTANGEMFAALSEALSQCDRDGVTKTIWSNEWLAPRSGMVLPALQKIAESGHEIEIQCYVRRHDKWAISAYSQWGLKHKSYDGRVRDFESWMPVFGGRSIRFADDIKPWHDAFSDKLKVFNFDAIGDVVEHFLVNNQIAGVRPINENVSPSAVEIAAQAVFNSKHPISMRPSEYDKVANLLRRDAGTEQPLSTIDKLFPSQDALKTLLDDRRDDIATLNEHLARNGQPELDFTTPPRPVEHPTPWAMDQYLLRLVFGLNDELIALRARVATLEASHKAKEK